MRKFECCLRTSEREDCNLKTSKLKVKDLPMIEEKKTSELIETWLVYLLSAAVAVGAFLLVWLISALAVPRWS